jgi:phosphatidylserine decarboxylase
MLPVVKGHQYSLEDFLGDSDLAAEFRSGSQYTVYLSPRDYHRVHAPEAGTVTKVERLGADLWPVRPDVLTRRPQAFVENERVLFHIDTSAGHRAILVMVGATIVGSVVPSIPAQIPCSVERGQEVGQFRLGSTVVYLTDTPLQPVAGVSLPCGILMGQQVANLNS